MIWLEPTGARLRLIDGDPNDRPPYRALGILTFHRDIAVMDGLHGKIRPKEVTMFYRKLRSEHGIRWLLAERTGNHRMPFADRIETGPFEGWWVVDLTQFDKEESRD